MKELYDNFKSIYLGKNKIKVVYDSHFDHPDDRESSHETQN